MDSNYAAELGSRFRELLPIADQRMLARYYLHGETPESICRSFGISMAEFRARKAACKSVLTAGLTPECHEVCVS
jgi:hypothetical protein